MAGLASRFSPQIQQMMSQVGPGGFGGGGMMKQGRDQGGFRMPNGGEMGTGMALSGDGGGGRFDPSMGMDQWGGRMVNPVGQLRPDQQNFADQVRRAENPVDQWGGRMVNPVGQLPPGMENFADQRGDLSMVGPPSGGGNYAHNLPYEGKMGDNQPQRGGSAQPMPRPMPPPGMDRQPTLSMNGGGLRGELRGDPSEGGGMRTQEGAPSQGLGIAGALSPQPQAQPLGSRPTMISQQVQPQQKTAMQPPATPGAPGAAPKKNWWESGSPS